MKKIAKLVMGAALLGGLALSAAPADAGVAVGINLGGGHGCWHRHYRCGGPVIVAGPRIGVREATDWPLRFTDPNSKSVSPFRPHGASPRDNRCARRGGQQPPRRRFPALPMDIRIFRGHTTSRRSRRWRGHKGWAIAWC